MARTQSAKKERSRSPSAPKKNSSPLKAGAEDDAFTAAVRQYKYTSPDLSLFETLFLNAFWTWVAASVSPARHARR